MEIMFGNDIKFIASKLKGEDPDEVRARVSPRVLNGARAKLEEVGEEVFYVKLASIDEIYCMTPEECADFLARRDAHEFWSIEKNSLAVPELLVRQQIGRLKYMIMGGDNESAYTVPFEYELLRFMCHEAAIIEYVD